MARAFPDAALCDQAHELIGEALTALVENGYALDAARRIVRAAVETITEEYEGG